MPKNCCAFGCCNVYKKGCGLQFYRFPVDPDRRRRWIAAVDRKDWEPTEYTWICSEHFITGTKSNDPLAPNYIPSIFKHLTSPIKRRLEGKASDYQRRQVTKKRRAEEASRQELAEKAREKELKDEAERMERLMAEEEKKKHLEEIERQRRIAEMDKIRIEQLKRVKESEKQQAIENVKQLEELKAANEALVQHNKELLLQCSDAEQCLSEVNKEKHKLESQLQVLSQQVLSEVTLKGNDKKVKFFTGLPSFSVLQAVYNLAAKELPEPADCPLFDQYLLTLVKLRLNAGDLDLAYRFGISQASVFRYIHKWVDILYTRLSFLIHWPERPDLMKTMPNDF